MEIEVCLLLTDEDDLESILLQIEQTGEKDGFVISTATSIPDTAMTASEIAVNLVLNFTGSVVASIAIGSVRALISQIKQRHRSVIRGSVGPK